MSKKVIVVPFDDCFSPVMTPTEISCCLEEHEMLNVMNLDRRRRREDRVAWIGALESKGSGALPSSVFLPEDPYLERSASPSSVIQMRFSSTGKISSPTKDLTSTSSVFANSHGSFESRRCQTWEPPSPCFFAFGDDERMVSNDDDNDGNDESLVSKDKLSSGNLTFTPVKLDYVEHHVGDPIAMGETAYDIKSS